MWPHIATLLRAEPMNICFRHSPIYGIAPIQLWVARQLRIWRIRYETNPGATCGYWVAVCSGTTPRPSFDCNVYGIKDCHRQGGQVRVDESARPYVHRDQG